MPSVAVPCALPHALAEDLDPVEGVLMANAAAALSVTRAGAQPSLPTRDEIAQLLGTGS